MPAPDSSSSYDALIVISFGGPEGMNDVIPFLENVLRGKNVPRERMLAVAKHYELFGGVSPINAQNRQLIGSLQREFAANGPHLPIYFGNRNWHPLLPDTLSQMRNDGVRKALAFVTSAYSSYSGCRQYLENIEAACASVPDAPQVEKIRAFYNHPEFIRANVEQIEAALAEFPEKQREDIHVVFTAHSIPHSMAASCDYARQLEETARLIFLQLGDGKVGPSGYSLAYQSRSGSPAQPWLEPDICDHLKTLQTAGIADVVVAPIGFVSDHVEVLYDLDHEAQEVAKQLGINMRRARTAGSHPAFVKMVRELVLERMDPTVEKRFMGNNGVRPDICTPGCCGFN
ncbi:MAG TPA: ferrochelatase [Pyrinomonadaceae bacterium]|nr:ferrochelatase [Pyrinomonadaceae bacterium]